jgi:hypothetical protein
MDVTVATRNTIASAARKILMIKQTPYFIIHILCCVAFWKMIPRIMNTTLAAIENINLQIDTISKELAKYGWDSEDVRILLSITGIDVFSVVVYKIIGYDNIKRCFVNHFF